MPAQPESAAPLKHLPQLDGLRGIAILLVIGAHTWRDFPSLPLAWMGRAGWAGVDLFFVLSGFLITRILLEARGRPRYYLNFYARRGLRIWPLYYLVLAFVFLINARWGFLEPAPPGSFWYYALYLQNFAYGTAATMPLAITWSLAIEEHFYLAWPAVVARLERGTLVKLLIAVIVGEAMFRFIFLPRLGDSTWTIYRADELAMGARLACWARAPNFSGQRLRRFGWAAAATLPLSFAAILHFPAEHWVLRHGILCSTLALGFAGVVALAINPTPAFLLRRALENPALRFTGKISYGMYLYHAIMVPIFEGSRFRAQLMTIRAPLLRDTAIFLVEIGMIYAVAALSWYVLEQPILGLKRYFADGRAESNFAAGKEARIRSLEFQSPEFQSKDERILKTMELIVYSAPWCRDCREAKQFLAKHNIPYTDIDIESTPGAADEVVRRTGKRAIPQFVVDGKWIQPYRPGEGFLYDEMSELLGVENS